MENSQNVSVKYFLKDNLLPAEPSVFHVVFNRWIQEGGGEILIDVVDYDHVQHGPVVVLVGHDANYSLDASNGRLGLTYSRKTFVNASPKETFLQAFEAAIHACFRLEQEQAFEGSLKFKGETVQLLLNNRLLAPNSSETFAAVKIHLDPVLKVLYPDSEISINRERDPRKRFALEIESSQPVEIQTLLNRVQGNPARVATIIPN